MLFYIFIYLYFYSFIILFKYINISFYFCINIHFYIYTFIIFCFCRPSWWGHEEKNLGPCLMVVQKVVFLRWGLELQDVFLYIHPKTNLAQTPVGFGSEKSSQLRFLNIREHDRRQVDTI